MRWMNARARGGAAYLPTPVEQIANIATHGVVILPVWFCVIDLVTTAPAHAQPYVVIYGLALLGLFSVSTLFHVLSLLRRDSDLCRGFHRGDRAMIFLFIAGSYAPWLSLERVQLLHIHHDLQWGLIVWTLVGIVFQQLCHDRYKMVETLSYVIVATTPAFFLFDSISWQSLVHLSLGGLSYLVGVIFFKMDGILPFAHALWHLFVVFGAGIHMNGVREELNLEKLARDLGGKS
ncbi:hypothetical protein TCAL_10187 [Tigriopus californicus]|uniref:Monocyte to macrophage differentiation protein n=1 Tax=Tigriopus californicus TaxID=6832 RepID=A0A553NTD5_TIGCA|nr:monocyte to macrophage differentiation factor 2-like [Tigriopus californicus]TRY68694.1 hypothetical protein TCAL_10187 [Tigriopus californicus]